MKNSIEIANLNKFFIEKKTKKTVPVFEDFSLNLPIEDTDKIISIVGKSGNGKSTLLRILSGLEAYQGGTVIVNNQLVKKPTGITSLIPQKFTCFPWLNVFENIAFGLKLQNGDKLIDNTVIERIATKLSLQDRLNAFPSELSGGMQQRVAIGRALAVNTPILLMDEPFGSLDAFTRKEMQEMILKITHSSEKLFILVTHDLNEAIYLSDKIVVLSDKPIKKAKLFSNIESKYQGELKIHNTKQKILNEMV